MPRTAGQPPEWLRTEARRTYGIDPESYETGRPEYPERVYQLLETRCGVGPGTTALEIGPGTGRVTRRLVDLGAFVTAVEPDPSLAQYLATVMEARPVKVVVSSFEDALLVDDAFDVAVAAMSFHWVRASVWRSSGALFVPAGGWRCGGRSSGIPIVPTRSTTRRRGFWRSTMRSRPFGSRSSNSTSPSGHRTWRTERDVSTWRAN